MGDVIRIPLNNEDKIHWKYLLRQLLVCSGVWNCYFMLGLNVGTPTVLVPQLKAANITVTDEMASWLPAIPSYAGIPCIFILSALTVTAGRKKTHILVSISSLIAFCILYFSRNVTHIMISQVFHGGTTSAYLTTSVVILTEYMSSDYRGIFLTLKSATFFWGILTANAVGTFFSWPNIAIIGIVCAIYNLVSVVFWPESPYWLASKSRFIDCSTSHTWLKGRGTHSKKELENLLKSHESRRFIKHTFQHTLKALFTRASLKVIYLSCLLLCIYAFSGKLIYTVYALDILKKITNNNSTAYTAMLILDSVTVASMYLGCIVSKFVKRRTMLLGFSLTAIISVLLLSLYLYLVKICVLAENIVISIIMLVVYSIAASCGPMIMSTSIIGELLPLESRAVYMCLIALINKLIVGIFLKISPYFFKHLHMHGTFFLYGMLSLFFLILIYFYMPETKNRTLQEINDSLKGLDSKPVEETKELMPVRNNKSIITGKFRDNYDKPE